MIGEIMEYKWSVIKKAFLGMALLVFLSVESYGQTNRGMVTVGSFVRPGTIEGGAGIWGYTGTNGHEYALGCLQNPGGLSIIDITNPTTPVEVSFIPSTGNSVWQEVNGFRNYAYKVSQENNDGLQIIDLAPLNQGKPAKLVSSSTLRFKVAHTVFVDSTTTPARLFVTYGSAAGVMIFTLADPENPVYVTTIVGETHDMFARGDRLYASNQYQSKVTIWNITNLSAPLKVSIIDFNAYDISIGEPPHSISHNAWPSDDNKTLYTTEETVGCSLKAWDISTATMTKPPTLRAKYTSLPGIISHNCYVKGNLLFNAHYTAGLRVIDITDPSKMPEIAYSRHSTSTKLFSGTWGCYPWFKSGLIVHGDFDAGIYIERLDAPVSAKYPNPEDSRFSIASMQNNVLNLRLSKTGPYVLSIYSPAGKEMLHLPGNGESRNQTLNLGNGKLTSGNYLASLRQDSHVISAPIQMGN